MTGRPYFHAKGFNTTRRVWAYASRMAEQQKPIKLRDCAEAVGLRAGSNMSDHIDKLEDAGYLVRERAVGAKRTTGIRVLVPLLDRMKGELLCNAPSQDVQG